MDSIRIGLAVAGAILMIDPPDDGSAQPNGIAFAGVVSAECSRALADGRHFAEHVVRLRAGQPVGVNVKSRAFAPVLEIFRPGSNHRPLAIAEGGGRWPGPRRDAARAAG